MRSTAVVFPGQGSQTAQMRDDVQRTRPDLLQAAVEVVGEEPFPLAQGLVKPVRWRETVLALHARGVERLIEVGPGTVLTGLAKRTLSDVELTSA